MNPIIFACIAGAMVVIAGAVDGQARFGCIGLAVIAGLLSMIEALALFRISIRNDTVNIIKATDELMRHRNGEGLGAPDKPAT